MDILVVGDVHGCYYTFKRLLKKHWNPETMYLVQLGDLVNKGRHSGRCLKLALKLQEEYPYQAFFLKGNHEMKLLQASQSPMVIKTRKNALKHGMEWSTIRGWVKEMPMNWENPYVLISHAGVAKSTKKPFSEENTRGVLYNRSSIKPLDKLQVFGHIAQETGQAKHYKKENAWCIDTGAVNGKGLTGLVLSYKGKVKEVITVPTAEEDLVNVKKKKSNVQ